ELDVREREELVGRGDVVDGAPREVALVAAQRDDAAALVHPVGEGAHLRGRELPGGTVVALLAVLHHPLEDDHVVLGEEGGGEGRVVGVVGVWGKVGNAGGLPVLQGPHTPAGPRGPRVMHVQFPASSHWLPWPPSPPSVPPMPVTPAPPSPEPVVPPAPAPLP